MDEVVSASGDTIEIKDSDPEEEPAKKELEIKEPETKETVTEEPETKENTVVTSDQKEQETVVIEDDSNDDKPGTSGNINKPVVIVEITDDTSNSSSIADYVPLQPVVIEPDEKLPTNDAPSSKESTDIIEITDPTGDNFEVEFVESIEEAGRELNDPLATQPTLDKIPEEPEAACESKENAIVENEEVPELVNNSSSVENELATPEKPQASIEERLVAATTDKQEVTTVEETVTAVNGVDEIENTDQTESAAETNNETIESIDAKVELRLGDKEKATDTVKEEKEVKLPSHLRGYDLEKHAECVKNGRVTVKPRLGVKVPHRNLTSQIVSKQEITEEIMERSRQRQATAEPTGNLLFAKKLTSRLARKLSPTNKGSKVSSDTTVAVASTTPTVPPIPPSDRIANNSDLIALLEGDDDTDWNLIETKKSSGKNPDWERETALKQLQELPKMGKKDLEDAEPRFSLNPVTKTYTRKRKPSEDIKAILEAAKKPALAPKVTPVTLTPSKTSGQPPSKVPGQTPSKTPAQMPSKTSAQTPSKMPVQTPSKTPVQMPSKTLVQTPSKTPSQTPSKTSTQTPSKTTTQISSSVKSSATPNKSATDKIVQKTPSQKVMPTSVPPKALLTPKPELKSPNVKQSGLKVAEGQKVVKPKPSEQKAMPSMGQKNMVGPKVVTEAQKSTTGQKTVLGVKQPQSAPSPKPTTPTQKTIKPSSTSIQKSIQNIRKLGTSTPALSPNTKLSSDKKAIIILTPSIPKDDIKRSPSVSPVCSTGSEAKTQDETNITSPSSEKNLLSPNTYISKSSRIVKRKKIWDPDEATPTKVKSPRPEPPTPVEKKVTVEKRAAKKIIKKAIAKKKRSKLSEIDRLLMDEGAVNLLYSVKNMEPVKKRMKSVISLDKAERELLNRTNEIKNDLLQNNSNVKESPIALRKKAVSKPVFKDPAAIIMQRKKSKDSVDGLAHVHTPPASPAYAYHEKVSRIIRRHSSSSFTSRDSEDDDEGDEEEVEQKAPPKKKARKNSSIVHEDNVETDVIIDDSKYSEFKTFNVRKFDNLVQIILVPTSPNAHITLTLEVLDELTEILDLLQLDSTCRVVVVSSAASSFCLGIDYKELVASNVKERKTIAKQYATSVKSFLLALSKFPKLIVAGVHGNAIGLGVTMLPLFDMVLASDTATFSAPYTRLGCAPEGGALLKLPQVMHNALASELFFASRKLTAAEGLRLGLVTRTLWPDKFQEELISGLKIISGQSLQSMVAIKKQLRNQLLLNVESSLKSETPVLIQHWISSECQKNFTNYSLESK